MKAKSKVSRGREEKQRTPITKIAIGALIGSVIYFAAIAVFAAVALRTGISASSYMFAGMAAGAASGMLCGFISVRPIKEKGAFYGALSGMAQALICSIVLFAVNKAAVGTGMFILAAIIIISSVAGGIAAVNLKKKKKY